MSELDPEAALLRGLHVAAMISASGALIFAAFITRTHALPAIVARASLLAAFATGIGWLFLVTQSIVDAGFADSFAAIPTVVRATQFGQLLSARLALLLAAVAALRTSRIALPLLISLAALLMQPLLGHAGAKGDWALAGTEMLHLLGAAAWLGGLLPLVLLAARLPALEAVALARRFSPLALASVVLIAGSAVVQASVLIGRFAAFITTAYGEAALAKIALFAALIVLGYLNRFVFIGALADRQPEAARRHLRTSIATETALGLLVVLAAGFLASLPPAAEAMSMPM